MTLAQQPNEPDETNAMAAMIAAYLDGYSIHFADLPLAARRRVTAYRHQRNAHGRAGLAGRDQHGPLPRVPPIDLPDRPRSITIEGEISEGSSVDGQSVIRRNV